MSGWRRMRLSSFRTFSIGPFSSIGSEGAEREPSMTDSRWELTIVLLVSATGFFSGWHFMAQLLH
jgi:hypothetical protein